MADKVPIRAAYSGANALTGLATFASSETIGVAHGGTGAATLTDNGILVGNAAGAVQATAALTTNGQVVVGGTSGPAVANIAGTANEVDITNGDGTITVGLSTSYSPAAVLQRAVATGLDITAETGQNASKIILVDLTDPATMWDVEMFLAATRFTSWRVELGAPPMRGAMFINNATTELKWWNLDTDAVYATFESESNDMFIDGYDLFFLDGALYVPTAAGLIIIDFLRDEASLIDASNWNRYVGDIGDRNAAKGYVSSRTNPNLHTSATKSSVAYRHGTKVDEFGRPLQWWLAGTDGGPNVYNPVADAIYTSQDAQDVDSAAIATNGDMWMTQDFHSGDGHQLVMYRIEDFYQNSTLQVGYFAQPTDAVTNGSQSISFFSSGWNPADGGLGAYEHGVAGGSLGIMGTDQGLLFEYFNIYSEENAANNMEGGAILVTNTYQTPYMKGLRVGAWPLDDVNDRSGNGATLTNDNSVTFTSGPFGNAATFVGSSSQKLYREGDSDLGVDNTHTISFYMKTSTDHAADGGLVYLYDGANNNTIRVSLTVDETIQALCRASGSDQYNFIASGKDVVDGLWHHICVVANNTIQKTYIDGIVCGSESGSFTSPTGIDDLYVGAILVSNFYTGQMAQLSITNSAWSENEVKFEYQRMLRGLGGAGYTIGAIDVDSVRTDPQTGLTAVSVNNQVEIWNDLAMRESINATTTATLNDADVRLPEGADEPLIAMGRSGQIGVVAPDRRILG